MTQSPTEFTVSTRVGEAKTDHDHYWQAYVFIERDGVPIADYESKPVDSEDQAEKLAAGIAAEAKQEFSKGGLQAAFAFLAKRQFADLDTTRDMIPRREVFWRKQKEAEWRDRLNAITSAEGEPTYEMNMIHQLYELIPNNRTGSDKVDMDKMKSRVAGGNAAMILAIALVREGTFHAKLPDPSVRH